VAVLHEAAVAEAQHDLTVEPARLLEVDVLERCGVAELRGVQAGLQPLLLAREPLRLHQEAKAVVVRKLQRLGGSELLSPGLGHGRKVHGAQLLQGLFHQHSCSLRSSL
jgi:hypothetical protein